MIWLAGKIFIYLLLALLTGGVSGWLLSRVGRNHQWLERLQQAQSVVLRQQDEVNALGAALAAAREQLESRSAAVAAPVALPVAVPPPQVQVVVDTTEVDRLRQLLQEQERQAAAAQTSEAASDNLIIALHREIARLRLELEDARPSAHDTGALELTVKDLEGRLVRKMAEIDRLEQALAGEGRKVRELERERELQNKSLLVLHQQLEMERHPQRAAG